MGNALVRKIQEEHNVPEGVARAMAEKIIEQAAARKRQGEKVKAARELTFRQWLDTEKTDETLRWDYHYVELICDYLQAVADGEIHQLIIDVPPGVGKTFLVSVRFPIYWMERNPRHRIILGAYIRELAVDFSMKALKIYRSRNPSDVEKESQDEWTNVYGGSFLPVGVGSGVTGRRAEYMGIDDPVKNIQEAMSKAYMDRLWNWWQWDMRTRRLNMDLTPTVIVMTRWAVNDLVGKILESRYFGDWTVLSVPALAESQEERDVRNQEIGQSAGLPDPLGRHLGESILPDRMPEESLHKIREEDIVSFMSLYQQRPIQLALSSFNTEKILYVDEVPRRAHRVNYWDRAASQGKGDFTVGGLMAMDDDGIFYLEDIVRGQWDDLVVTQKMREAAEIYAAQYGGYRENAPDDRDIKEVIEEVLEELQENSQNDRVDSTTYGFQRADPSKLKEALERLQSLYGYNSSPETPRLRTEASTTATEPSGDDIDYIMQFWFEQEPGSAGKATALHTLRTTLVGFEAYADKPTENKAVRARPFVAAVNAGNVRLKRAPWNSAYINELRLYVMGLKNQRDDQVDMSSGCFNKLAVERRRLTMS